MNKVSVIIPTYNCAQYITEAVDSVLNQTYKNFEVIVIDDGSTDNTKEVLASYIDKKQIYYIYQANKGPGAARNAGIDKARGNYIAFLDADDLLFPNSISRRISFLNKHPQVGMVFTDVYRINERDGSLWSEKHLRENRFLELFSSAVIYKCPPYYIFDKKFFDLAIRHHPFIKTPTVLIRKSIMDTIGGFNEGLRAAQDVDLWLRVSRCVPLAYIDEALSLWNNYRSSITKNFPVLFGNSIIYYKSLLMSPNITLKNRYFLRKKIAYLLLSFGYNYMQEGNKTCAVRCYARSFFYFPVSFSAIKSLMVTLLPNSVYAYLKLVKRKTNAIKRST